MKGVGADAFSSANSGLRSLADTADVIEKRFGLAAKAMLGFGAATTAAIGLSIHAAANYEASLDGVAASLGGVGEASGITAEQFAALDAEALRIGQTTSVSATEAASAMELMAKAGVSVEAILAGGAQAAVNIGEATGEGLAASAETMSAMLNLFADTGVTAEEAADVIVGGMNASSASMSEFQTGIARLGPTIAGTGMGIDEAAAAIAYFNAQGFSAAEVGTSLNSAFTRVAAPTDEAAEAMTNLGIAAFDAEGSFVGFPALMDQVQTATAGMSEEQRTAALNTIFGADALDVMTLAAKDGGDELATLTKEVATQGSAAKASQIRMDNFSGAMERLSGTVETLQITLGRRLLPFARVLVEAVDGIVSAFLELPSGVQTAVAGFAALAGALSGIAGGALFLTPTILRMADSFGALKNGLAIARTAMLSFTASALPAIAVIVLIAAALALLWVAYKSNLLGFGDAVNAVADALRSFASDLKAWFDIFRGGGMGRVEAAFAALGLMLESITGIGLLDYFIRIGRAITRFTRAFKKIGSGIADITRAIKRGDWDALLQAFSKTLAGLGDLLAAPAKLIGDLFKGIETGFEPLDTILHNLGKVWTDFGRLIQEVFQGDWGGALKVAERLLRHFADLVTSIFAGLWAGLKVAVPALVDIISDVNWGNIADRIGDFIGDVVVDLGVWILTVGEPELRFWIGFVTPYLEELIAETVAGLEGFAVDLGVWFLLVGEPELRFWIGFVGPYLAAVLGETLAAFGDLLVPITWFVFLNTPGIETGLVGLELLTLLIEETLAGLGDIQTYYPNAWNIVFALPGIVLLATKSWLDNRVQAMVNLWGKLVLTWQNVFNLLFNLPETLWLLPVVTVKMVGALVQVIVDALGEMILTWANVFKVLFNLPSVGLLFDLASLSYAAFLKVLELGEVVVTVPLKVNFSLPFGLSSLAADAVGAVTGATPLLAGAVAPGTSPVFTPTGMLGARAASSGSSVAVTSGRGILNVRLPALAPSRVVHIEQRNYALSTSDLQKLLRESQFGADFARSYTRELDLGREG